MLLSFPLVFIPWLFSHLCSVYSFCHLFIHHIYCCVTYSCVTSNAKVQFTFHCSSISKCVFQSNSQLWTEEMFNLSIKTSVGCRFSNTSLCCVAWWGRWIPCLRTNPTEKDLYSCMKTKKHIKVLLEVICLATWTWGCVAYSSLNIDLLLGLVLALLIGRRVG